MKAYRFWLPAFLGFGLVVSTDVQGQATLTPILSNGPPAARINVVVLSEGYTAAELSRFLVDATNAVNNLLGVSPYSAQRGSFNAFAISVASAQSGSDHYRPKRQLVDTYFNSCFDSYGIPQLVTIPPNDRNRRYRDGMGKVDALLQALMPEYDLVMVLVNDPLYGGSGGDALISSLHSASAEIIRHESGHTLADLADEYSTPYAGFTPLEKANATTETNRTRVRWAHLIAASTPVPTPATVAYYRVVGLFEGAQYQPTGWYRPQYDCKMNHLGVDFCAVCTEHISKVVTALASGAQTVQQGSLTLTAPRILEGNRFSFLVTGGTAGDFVIEQSSNLLEWSPVSTNALSAGQYQYLDAEPARGVRFFRAVPVR